MWGPWVSHVQGAVGQQADHDADALLFSACLLGERVTDVAGGAEDCQLFEVNMAGASGVVLGVDHKLGSAIVVLACDGGQDSFHV